MGNWGDFFFPLSVEGRVFRGLTYNRVLTVAHLVSIEWIGFFSAAPGSNKTLDLLHRFPGPFGESKPLDLIRQRLYIYYIYIYILYLFNDDYYIYIYILAYILVCVFFSSCFFSVF